MTGDQFAQLRFELNWTQQEVADQVGRDPLYGESLGTAAGGSARGGACLALSGAGSARRPDGPRQTLAEIRDRPVETS